MKMYFLEIVTGKAFQLKGRLKYFQGDKTRHYESIEYRDVFKTIHFVKI